MAVNTAIRKTANRSVEDLKPRPISEKIYGEEELSESFIDSIKQHGVLETIIVKPDGTIISGHRRWRAAKEVGLKTVAVKTVAFKDDIEEKEAIISYNFQREKTFSQKMAEAEVLHVIQKAKAEKRRLSTLKRGEHFPEVEHAPPRELGKTRDKVAVAIGIGSGRHYDKAKTIWDKAKTGDKEALKMVKKLDGKEITIGKAYRDIKSKPQLTGRIGKTECPLKSIETPSELPAENSVIKLGDHILIVGDNTEDSIIKTIKEHGPYDLSFADPPYGAGVEDWDRSFTWEQDYLSDIADIVCVTPGTISIQRFMKETKMPYVWSLATYITNSMTNGKLGFSNWFYTAIFSRKKSIYQGTGDFAEITLKQDGDYTSEYKYRQKPLAYLEWVFDLMMVSRDGKILDVFGGTGATLIVCQRTGRRCVTVERDREIAAQIIARYKAEVGISSTPTNKVMGLHWRMQG